MAMISAALWIYLLIGRGRFWQADACDALAATLPDGASWPTVTAIIPARNESRVLGHTLPSLLAQRYDGIFRVVLIDDHSEDDTADVARAVAQACNASERLTLLRAGALPPGWTGKLWAMQQAFASLEGQGGHPEFVLFTDADIHYAPKALMHLVARAVAGRLVLTSIMAKLHCASAPERFLIPAFVFFFQMLYPFEWVKRIDRKTAAAAGGCMLIRTEALAQAGGLAAIRSALIDDCALAGKLKAIGPIWLGLSQRVTSLRAYASFSEIGATIARTAYAQLRFSPALLALTVVGMTLLYLAPPLLILSGMPAAPFALATWLLMAAMFQPMLRLYRVSAWHGAALPAIAACYVAYTISSAYQHLRGRGGAWKGRTYATPSSEQ
jgi:hopene-associated glycosyltransferase HpnB